MTILKKTVMIQATPAEIDAVALAGERLPEWYAGIQEAKSDGLYPEVGGVIEAVYKAAGINFKIKIISLELDRGRIKVFLRLGYPGAGRLKPLFRLLLVRDRDGAASDTFAKIASKPFVERHVVLGDRHQPLLQQIVDVGAADVERDELAALFDTGSACIGAGCLIFDIGLASARIPQQLIGYDEAFNRLEAFVGDSEIAAGRVAKLP